MSAARRVADEDIAGLALAVYREPTRFGDLIRGGGSLPADTLSGMRTAAEASRHGDPEGLDRNERAALFFVEHVLLAYDADHYRVLGLNRGASAERIREHYRVMMGIFHPDRQGWADADREKLAARINLAYHVLRDVHRRSAYDLTRIQAGRGAASGARAVLPQRRSQPGRPTVMLTDRLPFAVRRNFPQYVLGSVAFVGVAAILTVYMNRAPSEATGASPTPSGPPAIAKADRPSLTDVPGPVPAPHQPVRPRAPEPPAAIIDDPAAPASPERSPAAAYIWESPADSASTRARKADDIGGVVSPDAPPRREIAIVPAPDRAGDPRQSRVGALRGEAAPSEVGPNVAMSGASEAGAVHPDSLPPRVDPDAIATPLPDAAVIPALTLADAARVVSQFSYCYQIGNIDRFMALFADDARSEAGGKMQIRKDYEQLFSTTRTRQIELPDLRWSPDSSSARGEGGYRVRIVRNGALHEEVFVGSIRVELTRRGEDLLISALFHKPSN
jgi:hypothetical protein